MNGNRVLRGCFRLLEVCHLLRDTVAWAEYSRSNKIGEFRKQARGKGDLAWLDCAEGLVTVSVCCATLALCAWCLTTALQCAGNGEKVYSPVHISKWQHNICTMCAQCKIIQDVRSLWRRMGSMGPWGKQEFQKLNVASDFRDLKRWLGQRKLTEYLTFAPMDRVSAASFAKCSTEMHIVYVLYASLRDMCTYNMYVYFYVCLYLCIYV